MGLYQSFIAKGRVRPDNFFYKPVSLQKMEEIFCRGFLKNRRLDEFVFDELFPPSREFFICCDFLDKEYPDNQDDDIDGQLISSARCHRTRGRDDDRHDSCISRYHQIPDDLTSPGMIDDGFGFFRGKTRAGKRRQCLESCLVLFQSGHHQGHRGSPHDQKGKQDRQQSWQKKIYPDHFICLL